MKISLVEGVDYIMENNRMVFTRDFLVKRGYCCNSRCRNCPYSVADRSENSSNEFPVQIVKIS
jgi:hypothetical protein